MEIPHLLLYISAFALVAHSFPSRMSCNRVLSIGAGPMRNGQTTAGSGFFIVTAKNGAACGTDAVTEFSPGTTYCALLSQNGQTSNKNHLTAPTGVRWDDNARSGCANRKDDDPGTTEHEFTVDSGYSGSEIKLIIYHSTGYPHVLKSEITLKKTGEPALLVHYIEFSQPNDQGTILLPWTLCLAFKNS